MKYLTAKQALADIAYFIQSAQDIDELRGIDDHTKWITVGGSYAGALSAWFRTKYPHLTVGAIGSSAVVSAIEDFSDFDEQVYRSAAKSSQDCVNYILSMN